MLGFLGILSTNPELSIAAVLLLLWCFLLLWRTGEPPILLFALLFQWAQAVTKVIHADLLGEPVQTLSAYGGNVKLATWLSMSALATLAFGMWLALLKAPPANPELAEEQARLFSVKRLWLLYLVSLPVSLLILNMAWAIPGGTQAALALSNVRWAIFFSLAYVSLLKGQALHLLLAAMAIEFMLGIGGYFADFKTVFFVTIIAFVAARRRLTMTQIGVVAGLVSVLFLLSLVWTAIKIDYRDYLNAGQQAQVVTRGYFERTEKLIDMVSALEAEDMKAAVGAMAERIAYVDFFGLVTNSVPRRIAHEEGALWGEALAHIFMPRLFFPDKPALPSDSDLTRLYTGLYVSGEEVGTSISIGYVAESYIDFGQYGMHVPILMLGFLWGLIYRFFVFRKKIPSFISYGLSVVVLLETYKFETAATKLLGSVLTAFLVAYILQRYFIRPLMRRLLVRRSRGFYQPR